MVTPTGLVFVVMLILTAMTGCFVYTPMLTVPLIVATKVMAQRRGKLFHVFHWWNNVIQGTWFHFVNALLQTILNVRLSYTLINAHGKDIRSLMTRPSKPGKFNILIVNHRTRIDWMLIWILLAQTNMLSTLKIVLKGELAKLPIFGWTMQTFRFLFLSRKWESDKQHLTTVFNYMKRHEESATFLIFPEGSDLSPSNMEKSAKYATENGLPVFRHILNPRVTGLLAMKNMIGPENIEHIYDITMGFTDHPTFGRPNEASLFNGTLPKRVHFVVAAHTFGKDHVPSDDEGFKAWVLRRFEDKEVMLSDFYRASPCGFDNVALRQVLGKHTECTTVDDPTISVLSLLSTMFVWLGPTFLIWIWWFLFHRVGLLWVLVVVASIGYTVVTKRFGGIDKWLLFTSA